MDPGTAWLSPGEKCRGKRQAFPLVASAITTVGNGQCISEKNDNHNHIEEVIHSNNEHPGVPVITVRLEQPANRRQQSNSLRLLWLQGGNHAA